MREHLYHGCSRNRKEMHVKSSNIASMYVSNDKSRLILRLARQKYLFLMLAPAFILVLVFNYLTLGGWIMAFKDYQVGLNLLDARWIGLTHFKSFLLSNSDYLYLLRNTLAMNILMLAANLGAAMVFAILLNEVKSKSFKKLTQSMMFLPYFISTVLVALLVYNMINYDFGFISSLVRATGGTMPKYYSQAGAWPFIIVLVNLWQTTGYGTVVYFAAITSIDESMLEAARVDGANGFQRIRYIILPCLKPTVVILLLFAMGGIVKGNFGLFYNVIGANSVLFKTTDIIETYVYRALMNNFNFSQGSAVGLFQSVVGFAIVMIVNGIVKRIEPDYSLF